MANVLGVTSQSYYQPQQISMFLSPMRDIKIPNHDLNEFFDEIAIITI